MSHNIVLPSSTGLLNSCATDKSTTAPIIDGEGQTSGKVHHCGLRHVGTDECMFQESGWFRRLIQRL
jgi:hypothetical protein